jgi:hypothetical protein
VVTNPLLLTRAKVLLLANSVVMTLSVKLGFGMHLLQIAFSNREKLLLLGSISTTFSTLSAVLSKTSFGLTLLRLTQAGYDKTRVLVWAIMISMNVLMFCDALYSWVECQPSRKHWDVRIDGTCWSPDIAIKFGIAAGAYSGCMDVVMAVLPWRIIWETRMEPKEKAGVLVAMSMGLCAGAAAFSKCSQIPQISLFDQTCTPFQNIKYQVPKKLPMLLMFFFFGADTGASLVILGAAEPAITIVAASIPALRVLLTDFKRLTQRRLSDQSESQGSNFDFWNDGSRSRRWSLFKWNGFGSSKSAGLSKAGSGTTSDMSSTDTTVLAPPAGLAARSWKPDPTAVALTFNGETFFDSTNIDSESGTSTPKTSITIPKFTHPAPSHNYPNLSQQLEDFLWSRKNSCVGTINDSIYDGDQKPVIETASRKETSARSAKKQRSLFQKQPFTRALKGGGIRDDASDGDTWSLSSVLEDGSKVSPLRHADSPGHFVIVQTTEITVEFE